MSSLQRCTLKLDRTLTRSPFANPQSPIFSNRAMFVTLRVLRGG